MATEFRTEISKGTGFSETVTHSYIANDASIAIYGPVILVAGASATADVPKVGSTTSAGDVKVFGVAVALPANGTITAGTSVISVCVHGRCKVKVADASVSLNDALECSGTAGVARVQPALAVRSDTTANLKADTVTALKNVRQSFAIALTTSSNANSIILAYINVQTVQTAYT